MGRCSRIVVSLTLAAAAFVAGAGPARAGDTAAAEALFREGKSLMESGRVAEACPKLEASLRADEATGTLLALAFCHESLGTLATAWSEYVEAAARSAREARADREAGARARANALEPRLSKLVLKVAPDASKLPDLRVERDQRPVAPGAFGVAVPIDGGPHVVTAGATGYVSFRRELSIAKEGEVIEVLIPALTKEQATPVIVAPIKEPAPPEQRREEPLRRGPSSSRLPTVGLALAGAGVVGLGVGGFFALRASSKNDASGADCDGNLCGPDGARDRRAALRAGNVSTILTITGAVLVGAGAAVYFFGRRTSARAAVAPGAGAFAITHVF